MWELDETVVLNLDNRWNVTVPYPQDKVLVVLQWQAAGAP
jgi:hypothetical protein